MPSARRHRVDLANSPEWLFAVLIAGVICTAVTAVVYRSDLATERAALEQETTHVIELQEELLLFELRAIHSDLLYLASQHPAPEIRSGRPFVGDDLALAYQNFAVHKAVYDQIRFIDEMGQEAVPRQLRRRRGAHCSGRRVAVEGESLLFPPCHVGGCRQRFCFAARPERRTREDRTAVWSRSSVLSRPCWISGETDAVW